MEVLAVYRPYAIRQIPKYLNQLQNILLSSTIIRIANMQYDFRHNWFLSHYLKWSWNVSKNLFFLYTRPEPTLHTCDTVIQNDLTLLQWSYWTLRLDLEYDQTSI